MSRSPSGARRHGGALAGFTTGLAAYNLVLHRFLPRRWHLVANLAASVGLVGLARRRGLTARELGLAPAAATDGVRLGTAAAAAAVVTVGASSAVPPLHRQFADPRVRADSGREMAYESLARIPVGTALFEELAFRGVLSGLLRRVTTPRGANLWSAVGFGLWHVLPTLADHEGSPALRRLGRTSAAVGAIALTAPAGLAFEALRRRSDSLVAPVMAHAALNSSAYLAAQAAHRRR